MKQLLQRLDSGQTLVVDVPVPHANGTRVLVETRTTVVSAGTERMLVEFGRSSLVNKARKQPEKVRQVIDKVRTDGLGPTADAVRAKLAAPIPLGYCQAGVVAEVGTRVGTFRPHDRVVTNGPHAEYVCVPHTLVARIPDSVGFDAAAFTPLGAVALQGLRLAEPTLGETIVVYGLGLIGLLAVQLAKANGCRVIGIDREASRLALAEQLGAVPVNGDPADPAAHVLNLTHGIGADAVLLTLASKSNGPLRQAAAMSRKRGRLVLVGVSGLDLVREDFYRKELAFFVSCSYGPGRYEPAYEEQGVDYPLSYVRWTAQRNFEAVLGLMERGALDPLPLITHRFAFDEAPAAYDVISGSTPSLGVVLDYRDRGGALPHRSAYTIDRVRRPDSAPGAGVVGVIGAGNFAIRTLLPAIVRTGARLRTIASAAGVSASTVASQFGFERATTDLDAIFDDESIDTVFVLTRHDSHARLALRALRAGKHVFVEKPLALREADLDELEDAVLKEAPLLMVGFNRRFAPLARDVAAHLRERAGPVSIICTVNAGALPQGHWTRDPDLGGGRIVGEACHFIDLARFLAGSPIQVIDLTTTRDTAGRPVDDVAHLGISFDDGSTALVHYLANGSRAFPKERIECFFDGKTVAIENWRRLQRFSVRGPLFARSRPMDKGHAAEIHAWMASVREGRESPIPIEELFEVSRWAIRAEAAARAGR